MNRSCPQCHRSLPADAPGGICPACLMAAALPQSAREAVETLSHDRAFSAPSVEELAPLFPQLRIIELLGHGGMGAVYRATQISLDRPVALKILAPRLARDPGFAERFLREARTMARLNHPGIVTVHDFGESPPWCYLVMELVEGINLREAILSRSIAPEQAMTIIPKICDALQFAHDQGVVHRDIKPENILIGPRNTVKIADFGLAKMTGSFEHAVSLTATNQLLGTRNYMAPEQIERPTRVDHRADIYSLGVVFYEMLTGELPLGRFAMPSEKSTIDRSLDEVVMRTLEKEPDRRYQQASEFGTAVEHARVPFREQPESAGNVPFPSAERKGETRSAPRRASLPFSIENVHAGFSQMHGLAHIEGHSLVLEYRVHKLGFIKGDIERRTISFAHLSSATLCRGIISQKVTLQGKSIETFKDLPGDPGGLLILQVDRANIPQAEQFCRIANDLAGNPESDPADGEQVLSQIAFSLDMGANEGWLSGSGLCRLTRGGLNFEFQKDDWMGYAKGAPTRVRIPLVRITGVNLRFGFFRDSLEIQTDSLEYVSLFPHSRQGRLRIYTAKKERQQIREFVFAVMREAQLPVPASLAESKPVPEETIQARIREKTRWAPLGLLLSIVFNFLILSLIAATNIEPAKNAIIKAADNNPKVAKFFEKCGGEKALSWDNQAGAQFTAITVLMIAISVWAWMELVRLKRGWLIYVLFAALLIPLHFGVFFAGPAAICVLIALFRNRSGDAASRLFGSIG
jgi:serine/threonine protein kinase